MKLSCSVLHSMTDIRGSIWISVVFLCLVFFTFGVHGNSELSEASVIETADINKQLNTNKGNGVKLSKNGIPSECPASLSPVECEKDQQGMEAIKTLHRMIDDDHNGNVDQSESDEFLRDELQYTDGFERQALFHNNDKHISVDDLWRAWKYSKVYNWTVEEVVDWLAQDVELPQYVEIFGSQNIDGSYLPRLVNATSTLLATLGIRNPVHKQKLSLKAMDTVLFGAPKRVHSYAKDLLLVILIIVAFGGCWFLCLHHRYSQTQVKKMMKDLESLQKAEDSLNKLKKELDEAELNRKSLDKEGIMRKSSIRLPVPTQARLSGDRSPSIPSRDGSVSRRHEGERKLKQAEEDLASLRAQLVEAESRLEMQQDSSWSAPEELKVWLQLTHELEQSHYKAKRDAAEMQLKYARESCEKIKKRNKAFLGSLRNAHSNSIDEIDQSLLNARAALEEVKLDLQERLQRWHTIELLCGFPIISNPGLQAIRQQLGLNTGAASRVAGVSVDETDEDLSPPDLAEEKISSQLSEKQRQQIFAWAQRSRSRWKRNSKIGTADEDTSIYQKIPERQRQQIFAWARRSRHNWMMKNNANKQNSKNGTFLPPSSSKTFLMQQTLTGSTNSLHKAKISPSGHHHHHHAITPGTPPVTFHLGDNTAAQNYDRSHSTSINSIAPSNGRSPSHFPHSVSHPPYTLMGHAGPSLSQAVSVSTSLGKPSQRPGTLGLNGHNLSSHSENGLDHLNMTADDSDSVGSMSVGTSASASLNRRLERTLELDVDSLDSIPQLTAEDGRVVKKESKKKKFLPKFLQSNKKVKSS